MLYALLASSVATRQLDAARESEERMRKARARELLQQARGLWEGDGTTDPSEPVRQTVESLLNRARELDPECLDLRKACAALLHRNGRLEEAEQSYRTILDREPHDQTARLALAEIALESSETRSIDSSFAIIDHGRRLTQQSRAAELEEALRQLIDQGCLEEAETMLRRALERDPSSSTGHGHLASLLSRRGRLADAEATCRMALELDPDNALAQNTIGVIYRKTGRLEAAVTACRKAVELEPENAIPHINLGVALRQIGRPVQAEQAYRRAIQLEPRSAVAHSSLGVSLRRQGRHEEAEACYFAAIEIDPTYTPAWLNLAIALQKRGSSEEAQAAYRCALELDASAAIPSFEERSSAA